MTPQFAVSGSCSLTTNSPVLAFVAAGLPALAIDPLRNNSGIDCGCRGPGLSRAAIAKWPVAGVPRNYCEPSPPGQANSKGGLHISLKSGNFGGNDFLIDALKKLA